MDTVTKVFAGPAVVWATVVSIVGLLSIGLGFFWLFNKKTRLKHLAELRKKLDETRPSDPEYNGVRTLYTSMVIDAERWGFLHPNTSSGKDAEIARPSGGDHVSDGNSDGGHH
jgi:hypothetical protein